MLISKQFARILKASFLLSIALFFLSILVSVLEAGYQVMDSKSTARIIFDFFYFSRHIVAFWILVYFLTNDKRGAAIAFSINMLSPLLQTLFKMFSSGPAEPWQVFFLNTLFYLAPILAMMVFGYIHFKSKRGWYLGSVYIVIFGASLIHFVNYDDILSLVSRVVYIKDWFFINPANGSEGSHINLISLLMENMQLTLSIILFWGIYSMYKQPAGRFDFSFRTVLHTETTDKFTSSVLFWLLGVSLFASVFRLSWLIRILLNDLEFQDTILVFLIISSILAIYVTGSFYRNTLTLFFVSKGKYPGWSYFILCIPVVRLIGWMVFLARPVNRKIESWVPVKPEYVGREGENPGVVMKLKDKFVRNNKNHRIKATWIFLIVVFFLLKLSANFSKYNGGMDSYLILIATFIISLGIQLWYFTNSRAMYYIYGFQFLALLSQISFVSMSMPLPITAYSSLVYIIILYPLFHFDKINFMESAAEPAPANRQQK